MMIFEYNEYAADNGLSNAWTQARADGYWSARHGGPTPSDWRGLVVETYRQKGAVRRLIRTRHCINAELQREYAAGYSEASQTE